MNESRRREVDEYKKQQDKLINTVDNRVLTRPKTTMKNVWACLAFLIIFYLALGISVLLIPLFFGYKILIFIGSFLLFNEFYLRYFGIVLVKCYQHYGTDEMRSTCKCLPSCSEYSILALKKYPLIIAFFKIYKRLNKTCDGTYKEDYP
jgi:putative component of membrane protein insertase Oxa1/YidC/SpoIIIJ protein YidD